MATVKNIPSPLYGVHYDIVARGGKGNPIIAIGGTNTDLFTTEKELIVRICELQIDEGIINITPFIARLYQEKYEFKLK